jgi:hypothetical protein
MITYYDLINFPTFEERLNFLRTGQLPSELTFDQLRELNQGFYNSREWKFIRKQVIARDFGWDLAVPGRDIIGKVIVHHMNPLRPKDLILHQDLALEPDLLITVSHQTHQAIHFGSDIPDGPSFVERQPGDTTLW